MTDLQKLEKLFQAYQEVVKAAADLGLQDSVAPQLTNLFAQCDNLLKSERITFEEAKAFSSSVHAYLEKIGW